MEQTDTDKASLIRLILAKYRVNNYVPGDLFITLAFRTNKELKAILAELT